MAVSASPLRAVELRDRRGEPAVRRLVSYAVGYPTEDKLDGVMRTYAGTAEGGPGAEVARRLVGFEDGARLVGIVGIVGLEVASGVVTIHHIAVEEDMRRGGLGRRILEWVAHEYPSAHHVTLETDAGAVEFYRRCGFTAERFVNPRWPEVERYRCTLPLSPAAATTEASA